MGGLRKEDITCADYELTLVSKIQNSRYVRFAGNPFNFIDPNYVIANPQYGDLPIEDLYATYPNVFGTVFVLSVLEHVENPFEVFAGIYKVMKDGGLAIVSTEFSFPRHGDYDYWRFTPECLELLAKKTGFHVLEFGWRLQIHGGMGILNSQNNEPQEIRSVYIAMSKGDLSPTPKSNFGLPKRYGNGVEV